MQRRCRRHQSTQRIKTAHIWTRTGCSRQVPNRRLQEKMDLWLQRGAQLNLPCDRGKSGLIHVWPICSSQRPLDPSSQPSVTISIEVGETPQGPLRRFIGFPHTLRRGSSPRTQVSSKADRPQTKALFGIHGTAPDQNSLLPKLLWAPPVWWTGSQHTVDRLS